MGFIRRSFFLRICCFVFILLLGGLFLRIKPLFDVVQVVFKFFGFFPELVNRFAQADDFVRNELFMLL